VARKTFDGPTERVPHAWNGFAMSSACRVVLATVLVCAVGPEAVAQPAQKATLGDLAWMSGQWVGAIDGARSEEVWTAPAGDSMLGMWRLVSADGKARVLELLTISDEPAGPVLRLRHFSRSLVAREDKDKAIAAPLRSWGRREAIFEGQGTNGLLRLTYRSPDPESLTVLLEHGPQRDSFTFARKATLAP
jgi:hypothetical protein